MNILYTITSYPPATGGAQQHFHEIALRLRATEELQVIRQWDRNRQDWLLGSTLLAPRVQAAVVDGIDTRGLDFSLLDRALMAPGLPLFYGAPQVFTPWVARLFLKRLRESKFRPDLIHHGRVGRENLAWASFARARELGIPAVLTPFHHPRWVGWRYREWLKLYRQADHVFALTGAENKILQKLGVASDRITVIGHGPTVLAKADGAGFRKKHGLGSHPVVLFLGQKYLYKGFVQLLDSTAATWKQFPECLPGPNAYARLATPFQFSVRVSLRNGRPPRAPPTGARCGGLQRAAGAGAAATARPAPRGGAWPAAP